MIALSLHVFWDGYLSGASEVMQHYFYAKPRLRPWSIVRFAMPWTPSFGNIGSFLVNCFVLRRFLTSGRSGVVKLFLWCAPDYANY